MTPDFVFAVLLLPTPRSNPISCACTSYNFVTFDIFFIPDSPDASFLRPATSLPNTTGMDPKRAGKVSLVVGAGECPQFGEEMSVSSTVTEDGKTMVFSFQSRILLDHSTDGLRSGEGSLVALHQDSLLLLYSEFTGGAADDSRAFIAEMRSANNGETWSEPRPFFQAPANALNAMCVSLLRLQDGRIGCVFDLKYSLTELTPQWMVSSDEGETWTSPQPITAEVGYFVVNNDRLAQLQDGTLVVPYGLHVGIGEAKEHEHWDPGWNAFCGLFYSRDGGRTWKKSRHGITHTPEVFYQPEFLDPQALENPPLQYMFERRLGIFQEPGVQELADGSLMLYMRSSYGIFRAFAADVERPWEDCRPIPGLNVCTSPQTIRRVPGSDRLVMLYNDRGTTPFGSEPFQMRNPLAVAFSDDAGRTWRYAGNLEGPENNYCYFSLLFHGEQFFITYYESVPAVSSSGEPRRRNLASLKFGQGDLRACRTIVTL
jgi:hypothetical protein